MNWADWTIVGILTLSCLIGLTRGFIKEAFSLVIWIAAFFVATTFKAPLASLLVSAISTPSVRELAAFAILFVATLIVGGLLNFLIGELVKFTGLSGTDRLIGVIFGLARGVVIIMAILLLLPALIPINQDPWWHQSALIPHFMALEAVSRQLVADASQLLGRLF